MNKTFKTIWSGARDCFIVASESQKTHGKPSHKKIIIATLIAAALGSSSITSAKTITNDSFSSGEYDSTKFISENGEDLRIQTDGDLRKLAQAIFNKDSSAFRQALGFDGNNATLVGLAGGSQFIDDKTDQTLGLPNNSFISGNFPESVKNAAKKIQDKTEAISQNETIKNTAPGKIIIGSQTAEKSTPLVLGITGADNFINTGLQSSVLGFKPNNKKDIEEKQLIRQGDTFIESYSGNLFGITGGSLGLNMYGPYASVKKFSITAGAQALSKGTLVELQGNTHIALSGSTTAAAIFSASSALALGGTSSALITGDTNLLINTDSSASGFEGMTLGAFGGGLSFASLGGTSSSVVNGKTTIHVSNGMVAGTFGGGAALAAEFDGVWNPMKKMLLQSQSFKNYVDNIHWGENDELLVKGGNASVSSENDIRITVDGNAQTAFVVGGGLAMSSAGAAATQSQSTATAKDIYIVYGKENGPTISAEQKSTLISGLKELKSEFTSLYQSYKNNQLGNINVNGELAKIQSSLEKVTAPNTHVGTIGGGLAIARSGAGANDQASSLAQSSVDNVYLTYQSGYNVATMAGGVALAQETKSNGSTVKAEAKTASTTIHVTGGENVLLMGGGGAYATSGNGQNSNILAQSSVDKATILISDGSVDGLYGGGMAIDDTYAAKTNASVTTKEVIVQVDGGIVNEAHLNVILDNATGNPPSLGYPSNGTYAHESADLATQAHVAILGAGVATGAGAAVITDKTSIVLNGGTITGNIFGGGAATVGGSSKVASAHIVVNGARVEKDIYAGGLAGSERNDAYGNSEQYKQAQSSVDSAVITLASGTVLGDIYLGGYSYVPQDAASMSAKTSVKTGKIILQSADVFQGAKLSGDHADTADLLFGNFSRNFTKNGQSVVLSGFDSISGQGGEMSGLEFAFGDKNATTITNGIFSFDKVTDGSAAKTIDIGSQTATTIVSFADITNAGTVRVATGSMLGLGNNANLLSQTKQAASVTQKHPAIFASGNVDLSGSTILAGTQASPSTGLVVQNGALVVDAAGKTSISNGTVTLQGDSILYFQNVGLNLSVGETTQTGNIKLADKPNTVKLDNIFWKYEYAPDTYTLTEKTKQEIADSTGVTSGSIIDFYNRLSANDVLRQRIAQGTFRGEANLKGGMNLAAVAGVQSAALQGLTMATDAAQKRASLAQNFVDGTTGFAEISGSRLDMGGNSSMNEINAELGGVIVGGQWTQAETTVGALAHVGTGSVRGQADNSGVKNDVNYYGASVYAGKRWDNFNIVGQIGYQRSKNDLTDSSIGYAKVDGVKTDAWTIGLRAEMSYALSEKCRTIPYVGFNYVRLLTDDYTVSNATHVSGIQQNLVTIPIGVLFTDNMETTSGWTLQPLVDVAYIGAFADRDVQATTTVGSVSGAVGMDVWSENAFRTRFGLEATKDNFSVSAQLGAAWGSNDMKAVSGQISTRYRF